MSGNLVNSNYPQFQRALNTVAQDAARGNERFPARNFLLDEGASVARANPYLASVEPRIASAEGIERFPDDEVARNGLAEVLKEMGRLPEAKLRYEQALKIDPADSFVRERIKRLDSPIVARNNTLPPVRSTSRSAALALRLRHMARHRGVKPEATLPPWEESSLRSAMTQAERVFEALVAR